MSGEVGEPLRKVSDSQDPQEDRELEPLGSTRGTRGKGAAGEDRSAKF